MGKILFIDDFRPRITETMRCLFCGDGARFAAHVTGTRNHYFPCPGCDETASVRNGACEHAERAQNEGRIGGSCAIRTRDQLVKSQLLYRLS